MNAPGPPVPVHPSGSALRTLLDAFDGGGPATAGGRRG